MLHPSPARRYPGKMAANVSSAKKWRRNNTVLSFNFPLLLIQRYSLSLFIAFANASRAAVLQVVKTLLMQKKLDFTDRFLHHLIIKTRFDFGMVDIRSYVYPKMITESFRGGLFHPIFFNKLYYLCFLLDLVQLFISSSLSVSLSN